MNHEIRRGTKVLETLTWEGAPWTRSPENEQRRSALREKAIARAYEIGGLAYEVRNPEWAESDHTDFACAEVGAAEVAVTTPLGVFRLAARRVRKGEHKTAVAVGRGAVGFGRVASDDQESPPVRIAGRLNPPTAWTGWRFQASHFVYADGTSSDFLGSYPREIEWDVEPDW